MKKALKDLAHITSGLHFRGKVESDTAGNVALIQIKDLDEDFVLHPEALERVHLEKPEPYLVRQGDVLFVARGSRLGAAEIKEPLENTVATGSFFLLRPRDAVLPAFLAWSFNAPHVQNELRRAGQGTGLLLVRRADLEPLVLDVPPLDTQRAIVALDECARRERRLLGELGRKRALLVEAVASRAVQHHSTKKNTS